VILVDTGAFYALADRSDRNHATAVECLKSIDEELATHPLIVAETWYMLENRLGRSVARRFADQIALRRIELLAVEADDVTAALVVEQRYRDLAIGLTDAISLAVCERERITSVFTFDRKDFGSFRPAHVRALRLLPE
jgi:predicted nucleic acid-binding protein